MTFVSTRGRPPRGTTFRELYYNEPIEHRQDIVRTGIREARAGNVRWATWLAQISGELAAVNVAVLTSSPMLDAIAGMRAALGLAPLGEPQTTDAQPIDSTATLLPDSTHVLPDGVASEAQASEPAATRPRRRRARS